MQNQNVTEKNETKEYQSPKGASKPLLWKDSAGKEREVLASADWILLRKKEKPVAEIFHTFYRIEKSNVKRPLTFVFNGGPGAASCYLHLGGLGPQRVKFSKSGDLLPPPVDLINNEESWIEFTDLVFVDPVGTGLSRAIEAEEKAGDKEKKEGASLSQEKDYFQVGKDLESLGEFVNRFLSKHDLWNVPVYVAGESYGGFRAAKLARSLQETHGVSLSGTMAISPALELTYLSESDYDTLRYMDTFCSMALAASYHGKSRVFRANESVVDMRREIEEFATRELAHALLVGEAHDSALLNKVFARAADFLGLSTEYVARAKGRVAFWRFARELLRAERKVLGFYDATITAIDPFPDRDMNEGPDPTLTSVGRVFESGINQMLRTHLGLKTDRVYNILSREVFNTWKRDEKKHAFDLMEGSIDDLRFAMSMNPNMKVMITHGYYDLVTPYFTSERLVQQMKLLPEQREKLFVKHFGGGHMFYTWEESRKKFRDWAQENYL